MVKHPQDRQQRLLLKKQKLNEQQQKKKEGLTLRLKREALKDQETKDELRLSIS